MKADTRTPAEILKAARARIADPAHWCQNVNARSAKGNGVRYSSPRAVAWCAFGAINAEVRDPMSQAARDTQQQLDAAARGVFRRYVTAINDEGTHEDVLAMYDAAIAAAEAEEAGR